jgi:formate dehydrogenase iron-sulfur subunit
VRGVEVIDQILAADDDTERDRHLVLLEDLCEAMTDGSMCAMGGLTPLPVRSAMAMHLERVASEDVRSAR